MTKQLRGIIELGDPDCVHDETVRNEEEYNNHQIGRCKKCGRVRDYTIAQDWGWNNKSSKGGKKIKEKKSNSLSRGILEKLRLKVMVTNQPRVCRNADGGETIVGEGNPVWG